MDGYERFFNYVNSRLRGLFLNTEAFCVLYAIGRFRAKLSINTSGRF